LIGSGVIGGREQHDVPSTSSSDGKPDQRAMTFFRVLFDLIEKASMKTRFFNI
jgi:hypothetical protein